MSVKACNVTSHGKRYPDRMLPDGPATLADVAARAGVSLATASRALTGSAHR